MHSAGKPLPGANIDLTHPLARGLVSYWLLNEGGGTRICDSVPGGVDGDYTNVYLGPTPSQGPIVGWRGPQLRLGDVSSASDNVSFGSDLRYLPTVARGFSFSAILTPRSYRTYNTIFSRTDTGDSWATGYGAYFNSLGDLNFWLEGYGNGPTTTDTPIRLDKRIHVVCTWDGATASIYINGRLNISAARSTSLTDGGFKLRLGIHDGSTGSMDATYESAAYWGRCLSAQEVSQLYVDPYAAFRAGPQFRGVTAANVLTCGVGAFTLTGQAAAKQYNRIMPSAVGGFTLSGQAVGLNKGRTLAAALGTFALAGQAASFQYNRAVTAAVGAFTLTGTAAALTYSGAAGVVGYVGQDIGKPLHGQPIDWSSPFSRSLSSFFLLNEGAGLRVNNVVPGSAVGMFAKASTPYPTWKGGGVNFVDNGDFIDSGEIARYLPVKAKGFSFLVRLSRQTTTAGVNQYDGVIGMTDASGSWSNGWGLYNELSSSTQYSMRFWIQGYSANYAQTPSLPLPDLAREQIFIGTWDGATIRLYQNGALVASAANSQTPSSASVTNMNIGRQGVGYGGAWLISCAATWDRCLSPAEVSRLTVDPYAAWREMAFFTAGAAAPKVLTGAAGAFTLSGQAAALKCGRVVTAAAGTFTLTGVSAGLKLGRVVAAVVGVFTLTGKAVGLLLGRKVTASVGAFNLTGQAAGVFLGRKVAASTGNFVLSGQSANLIGTRKLTSAAGAFTITGQAANLLLGRKVGAAVGSFVFTGQDIIMTQTTANGEWIITARRRGRR